MKHFAAAALLLAGLVLAAAPAQAAEYNNTALNLLWDCDDDPQTGQSDQIFCHGYMTGFIEGYSNQTHNEKTYDPAYRPLFCIPVGVTAEQARRVFVKWVNDHPEGLHLPRVIAVALALKDAFPCK